MQKQKQDKKILIGLIGTIGSGKTTASDYLVKKGFYRITMGDLVREIAKKLKMPLTRKNLQKLGAGKVKGYTKKYWAEETIKRLKKSKRKKLLIDGIRKPIDAIIPKKQGAKIIFIDAPQKIRYKRLVARAREGEERLTLKKFKEAEQNEFKYFDFKKTLRYVDYKIYNNANLNQFYNKIDVLIKKLER